jgi:aspartate aminotransferase-like enzyme
MQDKLLFTPGPLSTSLTVKQAMLARAMRLSFRSLKKSVPLFSNWEEYPKKKDTNVC